MTFMKKHTARALTAAVLALCVFGAPCAQAAQKSEIVYATLDVDGSVENIYVVNRFELDNPENLTDYGDYTRIDNLTDLSSIEYAQGEARFSADEGVFYYQGNLNSQRLPWQFRLGYTLDGQSVSGADMAGKSGRVRIALSVTQDGQAEPTFFENYALSISLTLEGERFKNISAQGGAVASSGKDSLISFTVLPGSGAELSVEADARDFELGALSINALPLSLDVDGRVDTSSIKSDVGRLQDGIGELDSGADKLNQAASQLKSGTSTLYEGSKQIQSGIGQIDAGASQLAASSGAVMQQLSALSDGLEQLKSAEQIAQAGGDLAAGATKLAQSLSDLKETTVALESAAGQLSSTLNALSSSASSCAEEIQTLKTLLARAQQNQDARTYLSREIAALGKVLGTLEGLDGALSPLAAQYSAFYENVQRINAAIDPLKEAAAQLSGGVNAYTAPASALAQAVSGFDAQSAAQQYAQFDAGVQQLSGAVSQLSTSYEALHSGIQSLSQGAGQLKSGAGALSEGAGTLRSETSDLDERVDEEVDSALSQFGGDGFEPVSFVDARNSVTQVQFVIRTASIKAPEPASEEEVVQEDAAESFWDKFTALFPDWR